MRLQNIQIREQKMFILNRYVDAHFISTNKQNSF